MGDGTPSPFLFGDIMNNIFDAHAHYDDDWFSDDREELLLRLPSKGVCGIVNAASLYDFAANVFCLFCNIGGCVKMPLQAFLLMV